MPQYISHTFLKKTLIQSFLILALAACGGGNDSDKSTTPKIKCLLTWELDEVKSGDKTQSETLIDSCTNSIALFDTPDDTVEWNMTSANKRNNIIISGDLSSKVAANNYLSQVNTEGDTVRGTYNADYIKDEIQARDNFIIHPEGIRTEINTYRSKDSAGLSFMSYNQWILNVDQNGVQLDWELELYCNYYESTDFGRCSALNDPLFTSVKYNVVAIFHYDEWLEIQEQFNRGVEVDSATTISIILNEKRIDL